MKGDHHRRTAGLAVSIAVLLMAVACSGDDDGDRTDGTESDTSTEPSSGPPADPLQITTDLGAVQGADSAVDGVRAFLTIPYAAPPTGENRWQPPQPREPYDGTLDATVPGASCPQNIGSSSARFTVIPDPDEDCLTLNVWSPTDAADLPVMFWIYGGGFRAGSAHQPYYNGDDLASEGVVVVSANYRLGAFGFLATDELAAESDDGSYGNYGLADQAAALDWVQRNVAAFGGDPANVTIFGESAGGSSVCGHLAAPGEDDLFQQAIIESGGGCDDLQDGDDARADGAALLSRLGCGDIACLRDLPTDEILAPDFDANLVADGVRLSDTGRERAERGELDDKQVLIGSNAQEAVVFTLTVPEPTDAELADLFAQFSDDPAALLALYPAEDYDTNLDRYRTAFTDARFSCPTLAFAAAAENDTYVYHYTFVSTDERFSGVGPTHGTELISVFAHPEGLSGVAPGLSGDDATVSADMQAAWAAFATSGNPGDAVWRPYADRQQVTLLDRPFTLTDEIRGGRCEDVDRLTNLRR